LEQLEAQNNGLKERYSKCENELKKIQQITGNLLKERDKIEKEREDTEQQLHGAEQPQRDILRQKLDRLIKEIHDITDELIKSDNRNEKLKIETQNLSGEITINNAEIDQKKSLKEKLIKKASELHNALTEQANKHAEEQLKIMSTLQQNRP
jgi:chromosome segregation ATPase